MDQIIVIKSFLGWCSIISICFYGISTLILTIFRKDILSLHSKIFNLDKASLGLEFYKFLAIYKIAILMFNIIPYLALVIMT